MVYIDERAPARGCGRDLRFCRNGCYCGDPWGPIVGGAARPVPCSNEVASPRAGGGRRDLGRCLAAFVARRPTPSEDDRPLSWSRVSATDLALPQPSATGAATLPAGVRKPRPPVL